MSFEQLDMVKCRRAATPGTDAPRKLIDSEELLSLEELYTRPDIQFAVKELS